MSVCLALSTQRLFRFSIPNDGNRLIDGIDLRYRFCYEHRLTNNEIDDVLDYTTCSVLEMMAALALKLDENIMFDFSLGSRIDIWFLDMIRTLGLEHYTDDRFYEHGYFQIINTFFGQTISSGWTGRVVSHKKSIVGFKNHGDLGPNGMVCK